MEEIIVQTRIPRAWTKKLKAAADAEAISVAALLRRQIMQIVERRTAPLVKAWVVDADAGKRGASVRAVQDSSPHWYLGMIDRLSATERTFHVFWPHEDGRLIRMSAQSLRSLGSSWFQDPSGSRFVLAGGSVWDPVAPIEFDRGDGPAIELSLRLERQ